MALNAARKELAALKAAAHPNAPATPALDLVCQRPRVGVGCILTSPAHPGALLVGARLGSHGAGRWALPGGHLEFGSSFAQTASEELAEECGLALPPERWAHVFTSNNLMQEEDLHYITLFLHAALSKEEAGSVRNLEAQKCAGWEWVGVDAMRQGALPLFQPLRHLLASPVLATLVEPPPSPQ